MIDANGMMHKDEGPGGGQFTGEGGGGKPNAGRKIRALKSVAKSQGYDESDLADLSDEELHAAFGDALRGQVESKKKKKIESAQEANYGKAASYAAADNRLHNKEFHVLERPDEPAFQDEGRIAIEDKIESVYAEFGKGIAKSFYKGLDGSTQFWADGSGAVSVTPNPKGGLTLERGSGRITVLPTDSEEIIDQKIRKAVGLKAKAVHYAQPDASRDLSDHIIQRQLDKLGHSADDEKARKRLASEMKRRTAVARVSYADTEPAVEIGDDGVMAGGEPQRVTYAESGGHWVTIGGSKDAEGKRKGGSPVYIEGGKITKGAPSLTGKKIALKESAERHERDDMSHRDRTDITKRQKGSITAAKTRSIEKHGQEYARAVHAKNARKKHGVKAEHLHQLAGEMLEHDKEFKKSISKAIAEGKRLLEKHGVDTRDFQRKHATGDFDKIPFFDVVASSLAAEYPDLLGNRTDSDEPDKGEYSQKLFDLLVAGPQQPMSEDDAYEQALEVIVAHKEADAELDHVVSEEPIPFGVDGNGVLYYAFKESEHPRDDHGKFVSAMKQIPHGDLHHVGGLPVRRQGENDFRADTDKGHVAGSAEKVAEHIASDHAKRRMEGKPRLDAIKRAESSGEPGTKESEAFAALPDGARVVSLDANTHGRMGTIERTDSGNVVKLDGGGIASANVEPIDAKLSGRVAQKTPGKATASELFTPEPPTAKTPKSRTKKPTQKEHGDLNTDTADFFRVAPEQGRLYAEDASGHEHKPPGPGGGQFTGKGGGGGGSGGETGRKGKPQAVDHNKPHTRGTDDNPAMWLILPGKDGGKPREIWNRDANYPEEMVRVGEHFTLESANTLQGIFTGAIEDMGDGEDPEELVASAKESADEWEKSFVEKLSVRHGYALESFKGSWGDDATPELVTRINKAQEACKQAVLDSLEAMKDELDAIAGDYDWEEADTETMTEAGGRIAEAQHAMDSAIKEAFADYDYAVSDVVHDVRESVDAKDAAWKQEVKDEFDAISDNVGDDAEPEDWDAAIRDVNAELEAGDNPFRVSIDDDGHLDVVYADDLPDEHKPKSVGINPDGTMLYAEEASGWFAPRDKIRNRIIARRASKIQYRL